MKRKCLLFAILCFLTLGIKAQDVFSKGAIAVNATVGIGSYSGYSIGIPPLAVSADVGVVDNLIGENGSIGVGGYIGFATNSYSYYSNATLSRMCFGVRGTFHYEFDAKFDTYAGLMLGVYTYRWNDDYINSYIHNSSSMAFSSFIGGRYYFSESMAINAEVGYGFTYISAGVTFKIK